MLASRLTTILPAMTLTEAIETTRIHRVAGRTGDCPAFLTIRILGVLHDMFVEVWLRGTGQIRMPGDPAGAST
jgi:magnesium chelatase family protein